MKLPTEQTDTSVKDCYIIDCNAITVKGDIKTVTFGPFKKGRDEAHLADLVGTLQRMKEVYSEFNPVQDTYENAEGFIGWFDTDHNDAESLYDEYPDIAYGYTIYASIAEIAKKFGGKAFNWPREPLTNYDTAAKLHSYQVFYIDSNGMKVVSEVEFDG